MVSAIYVTTGVINEKTKQVADLEAQNIANYVANAIAETVATKKSMPNSDYSITLDLPHKIAGKSYNIEVNESTVYVTTSDGSVRKSCSTFTRDGADNNILPSKVFSDEWKINISYDKSDFSYKFDFGTGDSFSHSPVDAGYFPVYDTTSSETWDFGSQSYRIPIRIANPSSDDLYNIPVKIVLNSSNFNYDYANVVPYSNPGDLGGGGGDIITATKMKSNLEFYDSAANSITITAKILPDNKLYWYQRNISINKDINGDDKDLISIELEVPNNGGPDADYIKADDFINYPITLDGGARKANCIQYTTTADPHLGQATFYLSDVANSLLPTGDGSAPKVTINGYFKDLGEFEAEFYPMIKYGDIYVDQNGGADYTTIQEAINNAKSGDTIYIGLGDYYESITLDKKVNLVGQIAHIYPGGSIALPNIYGDSSKSYYIHVDSNVDGANICCLNVGNSGTESTTRMDGIQLDGCSNVRIAGCWISNNPGDGIDIYNDAQWNIVKDCILSNNNGVYTGVYYSKGTGVRIYESQTKNNLIINCDIKQIQSDNGKGIFIYQGASYNVIDTCRVHDSYHDAITGKSKFRDGILISSCRSEDDPDGVAPIYNTIKNCIVEDYYDSTYEQTNNDNLNGIDMSTLPGGSNPPELNNVENCIIRNIEGCGFTQLSSNNNKIINCDISDCFVGIWMAVSNDNLIKGCKIHDIKYVGWKSEIDPYWSSQGDGIHIDRSSAHNKISYCDIRNNGGDGINIANRYVEGGTQGTIVEYCNITYCSLTSPVSIGGIYMWRASDTTIKYCNISVNAYDGIVITGPAIFGETNTIQYCNFIANANDGIHLDIGATNNVITRNNFFCNGIDRVNYRGVGIYVGPRLGVILNNDICRNNFINNLGSFPFYNRQSQEHELLGWIQPDAVDDTDYTNVPGLGNNWDNRRIDSKDPPTMGNYWTNYYNPLWGKNPYGTSEYYKIWYDADTYNEARSDTDEYPRGPTPAPPHSNIPFVNPNVIYVYPHGWVPEPPLSEYMTDDIQDAINHLMPGGTIYVVEKNPYEISQSITIDKSLKLIGINWDQKSPGKPVILCADDFPDDSPVIMITAATTVSPDTENPLPDRFDETIYIENIEIDGNNKASQGIFEQLSTVPPIPVSISGCEISNCKEDGIYITNNNVIVDQCVLHSNTGSGIYIDGRNSNKITRCTFKGNGDGIKLEDNGDPFFPQNNLIQDCIFTAYGATGNTNGIHLISAGKKDNGNTIDGCYIESCTNCGILIEGVSKYNIIKSCKIESCAYGIKIGASLSNNQIYYNEFRITKTSDGKNAVSSNGANTWQDTLGLKGNYWDDYTGLDNDFNGIGNTPYNIEGGSEKDNRPIGGKRPIEGEIDYSIEYWNPHGESVILLKMNLQKNSNKDIYLYCGSSNQEIRKLSTTSNDFRILSYPDQTPIEKGEIYPPEMGGLGIYASEPADPDDPIAYTHTKSEAMYVFEVRLKFDEGTTTNQANIILLTGGTFDYIATIYKNSDGQNELYIHKRDSSDPTNPTFTRLKGPINLPNSLDHWIRADSFIYLSKNKYRGGGSSYSTTNFADISSYLYDFVSMSEEGKISNREHDPPDVPILSGFLRIGCGLIPTLPTSDDAKINVDWVRLRKASVVEPIVTIGSQECKYGEWISSSNIVGVDRSKSSDDPFKPGPVLCDYHESENPATFRVKGLDNGKYTISVTMGDNTATCRGMTVKVEDTSHLYDTLIFSGTLSGQFETKRSTITLQGGIGNSKSDLLFTFSPLLPPTQPLDPQNKWTVNSITIEKEEGVKIS